MRFRHTMIRVTNVEDSLHFFCTVFGLVETRRHESEAGRFTLIFLAAPKDAEHARANRSPEIELTYNWPAEDGSTETYTGGRNFGHLAYSVDNIHETCADLMAKGVTINRPPRDGYMAFIKSPDGISIELIQEGSALEPIEPWKSMTNTGSW